MLQQTEDNGHEQFLGPYHRVFCKAQLSRFSFLIQNRYVAYLRQPQTSESPFLCPGARSLKTRSSGELRNEFNGIRMVDLAG